MEIFYHAFYIVAALWTLFMLFNINTCGINAFLLYKVPPFFIVVSAILAELINLGFVVLL